MTIARREFAVASLASLSLAGLGAGLGVGPARAGPSTAPNVAISCDPALRAAFLGLGDPFALAAGGPLNVFSAPPWMMLAQIERMTQTDILVSAAPVMAQAAARKLITPDSRVTLGRNRVVIAARLATALPHANDAAAARRLLANEPVALPDPTSLTTLDSAAALGAIGLAQPYPFATIPAADAEDVIALLSRGDARLGLLHATEVVATPALGVVAALPLPPSEPYVAAVTAIARSPNAARFVQFLATPQARQRLRAAGLEDVA